MKKSILLLSALLSLSLVATGTTKFTVKDNQKILWEVAGKLPAQKGYTENVGTAGLLHGVIGDYVVVGGGANFPNEHLKNGGTKVTHKDLYLLKEVNGEMQTVEQIQLAYEFGYGASVSTGDAIYYLGGSPDAAHASDVLKVTVENNKLKTEIVGKLPVTFENGVAKEKDGKIYFGVGKIGTPGEKATNSNRFFVYDIATAKTEELASFPGEGRSQTIGQILNGKFHVFSGGSSVSYVDGYAYDFKTNTWSKLADVVINGEKTLLLGANSVAISEDEMLVIGGFNYTLWNDANHFLSTLKDEELAKYKLDYFGKEPFRYNWNNKVLVYNASKNEWKAIGEIPFDAPCGEALVTVNDKIYSINGEIKPGVRTARIFKGTVVNK